MVIKVFRLAPGFGQSQRRGNPGSPPHSAGVHQTISHREKQPVLSRLLMNGLNILIHTPQAGVLQPAAKMASFVPSPMVLCSLPLRTGRPGNMLFLLYHAGQEAQRICPKAVSIDPLWGRFGSARQPCSPTRKQTPGSPAPADGTRRPPWPPSKKAGSLAAQQLQRYWVKRGFNTKNGPSR